MSTATDTLVTTAPTPAMIRTLMTAVDKGGRAEVFGRQVATVRGLAARGLVVIEREFHTGLHSGVVFEVTDERGLDEALKYDHLRPTQGTWFAPHRDGWGVSDAALKAASKTKTA